MTEGEFEQAMTSGYYESKVEYDGRLGGKYFKDQSTRMDMFYEDAKEYVIALGVPEKCANNVVSYAWQEGHSSGFGEVLNHLMGLSELFKERG